MDDMAMKKESLVGKRFGRLVAVMEVLESEQKDKRFKEYVCECDCGKTIRVRENNLKNNNTRSCGCLQKDVNTLNLKKYHIDLVGKRFGRLLVVSEVQKEEWKNRKRREYVCKCDCGTEIKTSRVQLVTGNTKSCGCLKKELLQNQGDDLTGQVFGELTAIKRVENRYYKSGSHSTQWLFKCSCGREITLSIANVKSGATKSCGHIGKSLAEHEINKWLIQNNVHFETQATFKHLENPNTGRRLKFDFKIYRHDGSFFIIEHHGVQHFRKTNDDFGKLQREYTDKIKKDYCHMNGITLYETAYNEDYMAMLKEIISQEIGRDGDAYEGEVRTG